MRGTKTNTLANRNILILADDLSGAADCAIACAAGRPDVTVVLEADSNLHAQILSIDLDTRQLQPSAAAPRIAAFMSKLKPRTLLFKKCDSTFRGHLALELATMLQAAGKGRNAVALFAPSYPSMGRIMRDGRCFVHGVALEDTEIWLHGGLSGPANVAEIFRQTELRVKQMNLRDIRGGNLAKLLCTGAAVNDVIACDAETDQDLDLIARAAMEVSDNVDFPLIWAGSGGLAHALGRRVVTSGAPANLIEHVSKIPGRTIYAVGSFSAVSRRQVDLLAASCDLQRVELMPAELLRDDAATLLKLRAAIATGDDIAIMIRADEAAELANGAVLTQALARLVATQAEYISALVLTGGETARAVLAALGIKSLRLISEIAPGVPLAVSHDRRSLPIITKAGAFGDETTFLQCHRILQRIPTRLQEGTSR